MINWNVTFKEDSFARGELDSKFQGGDSTLRDLLTNDVKLAGNEWSQYLSGPYNGQDANIDVQIESDDSNERLWVDPDWTRDYVDKAENPGLAVLDPFEATVKQHGVAFEVNNGSDKISGPDLVIHVNPDDLKNKLWFNPDPTTLPADKADAVSTLAHEIGHGLAFGGAIDLASGAPMRPLGLGKEQKSTFDEYVIREGDSLFFDGPNAKYVYGGPVPLNWQAGVSDSYHLGGSDLSNDLMWGKKFHTGTHYQVSALDLAILADSGVNVAAPFKDAPSSVNLVRNGSFEESTKDPGVYLPLNPPSKDITSWEVTRGGIDYVGTDWVSSDGNRSLDLNGTPGVGGVAQTFDTTPNQTYQVSFDLAGHYSGLLQTMGVSAAGQSADFPFQSGADPKHLGWKEYTWNFVAKDSQATLEFYSLQTDYTYGGPALDDVIVTAADTSEIPSQQSTTSDIPFVALGGNPPSVAPGSMARLAPFDGGHDNDIYTHDLALPGIHDTGEWFFT